MLIDTLVAELMARLAEALDEIDNLRADLAPYCLQGSFL